MSNRTDSEERPAKSSSPIFGAPLAMVIVVFVMGAVVNNQLDFGSYLKLTPSALKDLGPRVKYVLQHQAIGLLWLVFSFFYVSYSRRQDKVTIREDTERVRFAKNILTNSFEQFVVLFVSQLALVTYLSGKQALNIIPTINLLFLIGRILFFLGYPDRRGFGFALGFQPILMTIGYVSYRYVQQYLH